MKDANAEYVQKLRVTESATNQEIQNALHQLFKSSPQGHSILTTQLPQGEICSRNDDDSGPQGNKSSIIAATAISKIELDNSLKNSLHSALQNEVPYSEILQELSVGTRHVVRNNLIFKRMNFLLVVHDQSQDSELDFWRIVVP